MTQKNEILIFLRIFGKLQKINRKFQRNIYQKMKILENLFSDQKLGIKSYEACSIFLNISGSRAYDF